MGGYLGTLEEWERVSDAWDECLHAHPRIEYFKSDEAKSLTGQFEHLNHSTANRKKCDLAKIVGESNLQGFGIIVRHDLLAHRDPKATKRTAGSRTYDWGFFTATSGVLQYIKNNHVSESVDFIFDERRELRQCISMFDQLKELARDNMPWAEHFSRAGTCTPGDDKKIAALQMGDLLASEFSDMGNAGNPPSEAWKSLAAHQGIVHVACDMPWPIPILVELQGFGKEIQDESGKILKRIYKDGEKGPELMADCDSLIAKQKLFEAAMNRLIEIHESDEGFLRLQQLMRAKDGV